MGLQHAWAGHFAWFWAQTCARIIGSGAPLLLSCSRDLKIRDSYPVARYGSMLLEHHRRSLPEEECKLRWCMQLPMPCTCSFACARLCSLSFGCCGPPSLAVWLVYEQVAIAALDSGALEFAASIIKIVSERFPLSSRTRRLQVSGNVQVVGHILAITGVEGSANSHLRCTSQPG